MSWRGCLLALSLVLVACSTPPPPPATATVAPAPASTSPFETLPPDGPALRATLIKAGRPFPDHRLVDRSTFSYPVMAGKTSADGYPIYLLNCSDLTSACVDGQGRLVGSVGEVAKSITPIRNTDVINPQYHCSLLCTDKDHRLVGGVSADMLSYLTLQKADAKTFGPTQPIPTNTLVPPATSKETAPHDDKHN
jgi:hypothetical protein